MNKLGNASGYDRTLSFMCIGLSIAKGIAYPILKVTFIAMAEKLLRAALQRSVTNELYHELEEKVFAQTSKVTSLYLLQSFTFYQAFALSAALVLFIAVALPLQFALKKDHLNKQEVRRLQSLVVQKFIVEANSVHVNLSDATNLMYTRMAAVDQYVARIQYTIYDDFSTIFTGLFLFVLLAWDLGLITLVSCTLIMALTNLIYNKLSGPWAKHREDREATINGHILDLVVCKDVIRAHGQELEEQLKLEKILMNEAVRQETRILTRATFVSQFFKVFTFTLITPCLFVYVYEFDLTLARVFQLLIIIVVLDEIMRAYVQHLNEKPRMEEYQRAKQEFCHVLEMDEPDLFPKYFQWPKFECDSSSSSAVLEPESNILMQHKDGKSSIELANTTFGYTLQDDTTVHVIENFCASFELGDRYAIMGETGCGKSTIFKGLAGLLKPIKGVISVDGKTVDLTSTKWRRDFIGVVQQESILFNRSLRENLTYGIDDELEVGSLRDSILFEALEKVNMKQTVEQMPNGLDTMINCNGGEFSGGQRQRLQICRLLLRNRPVVLLDECTSALDRSTMQDILRVLNVFLADEKKTLIMITHDIQTLGIARHILNMSAGGGYEIQMAQSQPNDTPLYE